MVKFGVVKTTDGASSMYVLVRNVSCGSNPYKEKKVVINVWDTRVYSTCWQCLAYIFYMWLDKLD